MFQRNVYWVAALLWLIPGMLTAQSFPRGAVLDATLYDNLPQKAVQVSGYTMPFPRPRP
ncbi:hypothetical protein Holit_03158 [Hollandina sp. SP2]